MQTAARDLTLQKIGRAVLNFREMEAIVPMYEHLKSLGKGILATHRQWAADLPALLGDLGM